MINKLYEKVKSFMKENYLIILFCLVFYVTMTYPLPYYIYVGGGIINVDDKIEVEDASSSKGTFNMCYVSELKATIPTYLLSYVIPNWDLVSKEDVTLTNDETTEDLYIRDKIYLEHANQSAILTAYSNTSHFFEIIDSNPHIIYIEEDSDTDLKIGDIIIDIDDNQVDNLDDITNILNDKLVGNKVILKVKNNGKDYDRYAVIKERDNRKLLGISLLTLYDYEAYPKVDFHFSNSETGPSGGLILSLALYDKLVEDDITKGLKIAGTGTIDSEGKVGSIGGVKYKLKGAVDSKADIFIVPNGENYEECIQLQKKHQYDIKIIGVSTFEEAIRELKKI